MPEPYFPLPPAPDVLAIRSEYREVFVSCEAFLAAAWAERPLHVDAAWKYAVASIFGRCISTYRAALRLCEAGLPQYAVMLLRVLFEDLVAALWAAMPDHRAEVDHLLRQKESHQDRVFDGSIQDLARKAGVSEEELAAYSLESGAEDDGDELFGAHSQKSWYGNLGKAVHEVDPYFTTLCSQEGGALVSYYDVLNKFANLWLHNTPTGLAAGASGSIRIEGTPIFGYGQTEAVEAPLMKQGLLLTTHLFRLVCEVACRTIDERPTEMLEAAELKVQRALAQLDESGVFDDVSRNDPCPCGSGLKFKRCHGT